ncbi:MAG: hypothetical protein K0S33_2730 [Bacteroidetes bacterium]|jgi:hypothetical protein|nr:hypothetical protein [Bacteroidota bacterium]
MKNLLFAAFLFLSVFTFAQGTNVTFDIQGTTINVTNKDSLQKVVLPLRLYFSAGFDGKKIEFPGTSGFPTLPAKNFDNAAGFRNRDGGYKIVINEDRTTNMGVEKLNPNEFRFKIGNELFTVKILSTSPQTPTVTTVPGTKVRKKELRKEEEGYESGYVYYDALKLVNDSTSDSLRSTILIQYGLNYDLLEKNEYLKDVLGRNPFPNTNIHGGGIASLVTGIGSTDITYAAAGMARLIAERTKEELNEAFFRHMKEQLIAYPELTTIFPKTTGCLKIIESYSYASVIQILKEAFETDVRNLPENFYGIKDLDTNDCKDVSLDGDRKKKKTTKEADCKARMLKIEAFFKTEAGKWVALGMYTAKEAPQTPNPSVLLNSVTESSEFTELKQITEDKNKLSYNVVSSIELSNLLSQSLLSKDEEQVWINQKELTALFKTKLAFKAYVGLLLAIEQVKAEEQKIKFYKNDKLTTVTFQEILMNKAVTLKEYEVLVKNGYAAFNAANNAVKKIKIAIDNSTEADPQALYNYYQTFNASLKPVIQSPILKRMVGDSLEAKYFLVESYLTPSVDMVYHISVKQYSAAIYDASILLGKLTKSDPLLKPIGSPFVKYGTVISTVASAKSSDEVKKALEASVLPVGSSAIKRNSNCSITLNAYCGAFYGKVNTHISDTVWNATMNRYDTIRKAASFNSYGLYAPIGIAFNKGSKCGWGVSAIFQLADLGALVNFYMLNGDQTALPSDFKVSVANIFAPGAQLGINIPKTPITLTGGGQLVPALNNVDQISSGSNITANRAWRWQASIVVDIPLYNLKVTDFKK